MASMRRALGCTPCLAAVTPWVLRGGSPHPSSVPPPTCVGEAEAGLPGAAAGEAAGFVTVPGLPAVVCRGEGRWGAAGEFWGGSLWGLTPCHSPLPPLPPPQLTFVDFLAYDVLDQQRMFVPECPELQGNLGRFLQRFEVSRAAWGHPGVTGPVPDTLVSLAPSPTSQCPCPHP